MASTRLIRKRAIKKVRAGRGLEWALARFQRGYINAHTEALKSCALPAWAALA